MIEVTRGEGPIVLGLPHTGTELPGDIREGLNETGLAMVDTDWHIDRLYSGLRDDVTMVRQVEHRYVIDVNRPPDGQSLYPGQNTTDLCPLTDFDGRAIHREGCAPDAAEIARRIEVYHAPYHAALSTELARVKAKNGVAVLYDCHSIRSVIPRLFDGSLPDFNIGTNLSTSCAPVVEKYVEKICAAAGGYSSITNGRFRGGWTTRHYGDPEAGIHAIQMELAQSTYMQETAPWAWDAEKATRLRAQLARILNGLSELVETAALR
ncbi:MAG: N-formylglutamate deformylase [Rhodobacteraceae bacterium HLUCCO07]|nr:MAG: N-formylglutamate deformylase [Rhodobacteraceae bacterium HLUCCO07]